MIRDLTLRVLMIESSDEDVNRILEILAESDFQTDYVCVDTKKGLEDALQTQTWDMILSENNLPQLTAIQVIEIAKKNKPDIPVIVVSNQISDEAVEFLMGLGAYDLLTKTNLARLVPVIRRSISESENYQRFISTQTALQKSEELFQAITSNLPGVVFQFQVDANHQASFLYVSDASETLLGLSPSMLISNPGLFPELILTDDRVYYDQLMMISAKQLSTWNWEGCIQVKGDSDIKWISLRATPRKMPDGATLWDGIMINITRNKLAEREIARSREQLAELSSYLQKVKEQERARIAREIHDDIGGTLTAIKCELFPFFDSAARPIEFYQQKARSIESLVDRVIDSTRRISLDLRPGILDCGIVAAVQWQAKEFSNRTGIVCRVSCSSDEISIDSDLSIAIFRIFQETLTNISKHASATHIQVKLVELDQMVLLEVIDNGRGITDLDMGKHESYGIRGMRERCQQLKGNFHIMGETGKGTKVTILIPTENFGYHSEYMIESKNESELIQPGTSKARKRAVKH